MKCDLRSDLTWGMAKGMDKSGSMQVLWVVCDGLTVKWEGIMQEIWVPVYQGVPHTKNEEPI